MIVYLAGKITGDPEYRAKFAAAKEWLLAEKELEEAVLGLLKASPYPTADVVLNPAELPGDWPKSAYMDVCLAMLRKADMAVFLPDWRESNGARLERDYCRYQGIPTWEMPDPPMEGWADEAG